VVLVARKRRVSRQQRKSLYAGLRHHDPVERIPVIGREHKQDMLGFDGEFPKPHFPQAVSQPFRIDLKIGPVRAILHRDLPQASNAVVKVATVGIHQVRRSAGQLVRLGRGPQQ